MTRYTSPSFVGGTWLVAEREIMTKLRSKSFVISTIITLVFILGGVVVGSLVSANASLPTVAAVGSAVATVEETKAFEVTEAESREEAEELVRSEEVEAAIVPDDSPTGLLVIGLDETPNGVLAALSVSPAVDILEPDTQNKGLIYLVAFGFGIVFFMSAITFGMTIAQSVVEEKQTRIVEILMSTVPVRVLLAGKILGNSLLAFGQIALIALLSGVGLLATGQNILLADIGPALIWFTVFFAFGFVLLAALFAATAALVSRQEDMGSVSTPIMMLVMIPYFLVIFFNDNAFVLAIMSYVPFSAPVGMPMRVFLGTAEWWEPLLSLVVLLASTAFFIAIGSRIYANGLLKMGAPMKLKDALVKRG